MEELFKIENGVLVPAPEVIETPTAKIRNPTIEIYHKFGYWPYEDMPEPVEEEGYKIFDDGLKYVDLEDGNKVIRHIWRKLQIVDPGMPEIQEGYEFYRDFWKETETTYEHVYLVLKIVDEEPTIDPETQIIIGSDWVIDEAALTKTKVYQVRTKIDEPPTLEEGQQIVEDYWRDEDPYYRHIYEVRFVIDNPPPLEPGQQVIEKTYEDDGVTRTYHYVVRYVVDNPPVLEPGQQVVEDWWDDDGVTRTHRYEVRFIVDNPPELGPNQEIINDYWTDDGVTKTHVYEVRTIVDNPPELRENEFIYEDHWEDDGATRTHVYDVWQNVDEKPTYDATKFRLFDMETTEDLPDLKQRRHVYVLKEIVDVKPEDDPDGNFWWEFDYEEVTDTQVIIHYKKVYKVWRIFSKLKIEIAIFQLNKMVEFDAFLQNTEMTNEAGEKASLRRFYDQANELAENHKLFKPYCAAAFAALGLTAEQGEALLEQCVQDTFQIKE